MTKGERQAWKKQQKKLRARAKLSQAKIKRWLSYGLVLVLLAVVGFVIWARSVPMPEGERNKTVDRVMESDWVKGNPKGSLVLIEYGDFQCIACVTYAKMLGQLVEAYGNELAIVYRHFPLSSVNAKSELAAQVAEAAGKQGKFWEMHDLLYERQSDWSESSRPKNLFFDYAQELGMDVGRFRQDLNSKEVKALVKADQAHGLSLRLSSTPTFFLNGQRIANPASVQQFEELILAQLPGTPSAELESE